MNSVKSDLGLFSFLLVPWIIQFHFPQIYGGKNFLKILGKKVVKEEHKEGAQKRKLYWFLFLCQFVCGEFLVIANCLWAIIVLYVLNSYVKSIEIVCDNLLMSPCVKFSFFLFICLMRCWLCWAINLLLMWIPYVTRPNHFSSTESDMWNDFQCFNFYSKNLFRVAMTRYCVVCIWHKSQKIESRVLFNGSNEWLNQNPCVNFTMN